MMPIEQCHVLPGQSARRKLDVMQTEEMIKVAARTPGENGRFIVGEGASILGLKNEQTNGPVSLCQTIAILLIDSDEVNESPVSI